VKAKLLGLLFLLSTAHLSAMEIPKIYLREITPKIVEKDQSFTVVLEKHEHGNGWIVIDAGDVKFKRSYSLSDKSGVESGMEFKFEALKKGYVQIEVHKNVAGNQYRNFAVNIVDRDPENK
jgi:hypothetical protein